MTQEALKLALEAKIHNAGMNPIMQGECYLMHPEAMQKIIDEALREALAEQPVLWKPEDHYQDGWRDALQSVQKTLAQQEPVAWMNAKRDMTYIHGPYNADDIPLYTSPPQRTWVGLTYEEAKEIYTCIHGYDSSKRIAQAIEAKLKEKNT